MVDSKAMQSGRYKAYPEYKDSGVEWLGDIPSGWGVVRVKNQFKVYNGATPRSGVEEYWGGDIVWVTPSDLSQLSSNTISESSRTITRQGLSSCGTTLVPKDSLILSCRAPIGSLAITKTELCTNQGCKALVPISDIPVELYYYYFSSINAELNVLGSGSTFLELSTDELVNIALPLPTYSESKLICNFLDYETAKIDTLIQKQQRLIELLTEKRQAVISHAVTKGLNPDVPMKDSGVEWLGEVPEHWSVTRFNYEIFFQEGPGILAVDFHEEGVPLLRIQNVKTDVVTNDFKTYLSPSKVKSKWNHYRVEEGDLIISCSASTGLVAQVDESTVGAIPYTGLIRLKPLRETICAPYIKLIVQSDLFFRQIENLQTGSTIQHFGPYHLRQMYISLPPIEEQVSIYKGVVKTLNRLDELMEKANSQIELMQERRTALISAAVTGKIDVRDWVKPE